MYIYPNLKPYLQASVYLSNIHGISKMSSTRMVKYLSLYFQHEINVLSSYCKALHVYRKLRPHY
jgi:hypothetical protein